MRKIFTAFLVISLCCSNLSMGGSIAECREECDSDVDICFATCYGASLGASILNTFFLGGLTALLAGISIDTATEACFESCVDAYESCIDICLNM